MINQSKILFLICATVLLLCSITKFCFDLGVRIQYYEPLLLLFLTINLCYGCSIYKPRQNVINVVAIIPWLYFAVSIMSIFVLVLSSYDREYYLSFTKGILLLFVTTISYSIFPYYFNSLSLPSLAKLESILILSMLISAVYGIVAAFFYFELGYDLDNLVSAILPLNNNELTIVDSLWGPAIRLSGLTGDPSVFASFAIAPLIVLANKLVSKFSYSVFLIFVLIFFSSLLTISGSGLFGVITAFAAYFLLNYKKVFKSILRFKTLIFLLAFLLLFWYLYYLFSNEIVFLLTKKFESGGTVSLHAEIALNSLRIFYDNPFFGVGYNNFSNAYKEYYHITGYNPHNSWITYMVELGIVGLISKIIIVGVFSVFSFKYTGNFEVTISILCGLIVSSLGYEIYNFFYPQIFLILEFVIGLKLFSPSLKIK